MGIDSIEGREKLPIETLLEVSQVLGLISMVSMKVESIHHLKESEIQKLEYHSILNILNMIGGYCELHDLGKTKKLIDDFNDFIHRDDNLCFHDALNYISNIISIFSGESQKELQDEDLQMTLTDCVGMLMGYGSEKVYRNHYNAMKIDINKLVSSLQGMYSLVADCSDGRYRIVFNEGEKEEGDYLIQISAKSVLGDYLYMPQVLEDVIRDLTLNSRKYSEVGTRIYLDIEQNENELCIDVIDEGKGIIENEQEKVFKRGMRGTNIREGQFGFGLGLTKAYYVTKIALGGDIFMATKEGVGTHIRLCIPISKENEY